MTREKKDELSFDRSYWPEGGTTISHLPVDLNTLWEEFYDQTQTFVAESLIDDPPWGSISLDKASVEIGLWTVGNDIVTLEFDLPERIQTAAEDYAIIQSDEQAEEALRWIAGLDKIGEAVARSKEHLQRVINEFQTEDRRR